MVSLIGFIAETAGVEWICAACTFINEPNDTSCSICDTKKDTKRFNSCDPGPSTSFAIPEVITLHGSSSEVRIINLIRSRIRGNRFSSPSESLKVFSSLLE